MSRGLPGRDRRTRRRTRPRPPAGARAHRRTTTVVTREVVVSWCPTHNGGETSGACWCDEPAQMPAEPSAQDVPPGTGPQAAHGPAGRHDGHPAPDTEDLACPHCRTASPTHDPGCITGLTAAFDTTRTERTETP